MIKRLALATFVVSLFALPAYLAAQERPLDVPYVPTKFPVVDEMLKLANVAKADILYDLGCGDGRIVIGAAQKYGARAVGIDLDPDRIAESRENAQKAGVTSLVKFMEGDLFQADFKEASVLSLYLLTSVNLKLRPRILRELNPGTRVVSHNFGMDNWKPDAASVVTVDDIRHDVFLWIVPANISGGWTWSMALGGKTVEAKMSVEQKYQVPTATITLNGTPGAVKDIKLQGDHLTFLLDVTVEGKTQTYAFDGRAVGHTITGQVKAAAAGREQSWPWKSTRNPATQKAIDDEPPAWN
jgi:SAM-dependent methyltransferase